MVRTNKNELDTGQNTAPQSNTSTDSDKDTPPPGQETWAANTSDDHNNDGIDSDPEKSGQSDTDPNTADTPTDETTPPSTQASDTAPSDTVPDDPNDPDQNNDAPPPIAATNPPARRRGGLGSALLLIAGGVIAGVIGYGVAVVGVLPPAGTDEQEAVLTSTLDTQLQSIAALEAELAAMAATTPEVDFSPVLTQITDLSTRLDGAIATITDLTVRVETLESRPVFTGEVAQDSAAVATAVEQLQSQLRAQQDQNTALAAEMQQIADTAQTAIAQAESRAQNSVAAATVQMTLGRLRTAVLTGDPFADALNDLPPTIEVPETLRSAAETGVPALETLQHSFPPVARAALPIAIRETAGAGATDRFGAFLRSQIGGRSLEPRAGDDPDAILSRAQAALAIGDIAQTLGEISTLPPLAQAEMADWVGTAQTRLETDAALDTLAATLNAGTN